MHLPTNPLVVSTFLIAGLVAGPVHAVAKPAAPTPPAAAPAPAPATGSGALAVTNAELIAWLKNIDDLTGYILSGFRWQGVLERKQGKGTTLTYELAVYRHDGEKPDEAPMTILTLRPKKEAGKGYIRVDKNLFLFDPQIGKWSRQTDRAALFGTEARRFDFDRTRLSIDYDPEFVGTETLGQFEAYRVRLKLKPGKEGEFPVQDVWLDAQSHLMLKVQYHSPTGKLMRTSYYPEWMRIPHPSDPKNVLLIPKEVRVFDEVDTRMSSTFVTTEVELDKIPDNVFTKAWLEQQSR
jgi:hypothetical protein